MRRSHRLPPVTVTYLEKYHAYTSPPMPEKGALPTIIVTPADAASVQDFEIHFCSPKATQSTFQIAPQSRGFLPRMRSFFRRSPEQSTFFEKRNSFDDEEDIAEAQYASRSEGRNGGYTIIPQVDETDGDIPGVPTISERDWTTISAASTSSGYSTQPIMLPPEDDGYHARPSYFTKRVRTLLFMTVPIALVTFHLISHHMGLIPGSGLDGMDGWAEEPTPLPSFTS